MDTDLKLEILISTMNRVSLDFLVPMFPFHNLNDLNILIVNQTEVGKELVSKDENIRILNSYDKGLSKSRNLAIYNAIGDICLIADDDVEYVQGFDKLIVDTFLALKMPSVILFKIKTFSGVPFREYGEKEIELKNKNSIKSTASIEMAFNKSAIVNSNISFNELFGLGSFFQSGEEFLFLRDVLKNSLKIYFKNVFIVKHAMERSTSNIASINFIKTKAVLYYLNYGVLGYLVLLKFVFFLLRNSFVSVNQVFDKYMIGFVGIKEYKKILNE